MKKIDINFKISKKKDKTKQNQKWLFYGLFIITNIIIPSKK